MKKRTISLLLAFAMTFGLAAAAFAAAEDDVSGALNDTAAYLLRTVTDPTVGSTGGEWGIIGLARSGYGVPQSYFDKYYSNLEAYVREKQGVLTRNKYTEYSRIIIALSAIGKDPRNVAGYDLVMPLGDFNGVKKQGINGPIWALIALDSNGYAVPVNSGAAVQTTRDMLIEYILDREVEGGGWALTGSGDDADITGMALQALAKYTDREDVKAAVDRALERLSKTQNGDGSFNAGSAFSSDDGACLESTVQVLVALTEMGISLDDSRFVKNGNTIVDAVMRFYASGGGFVHIMDGGVNLMATEQGMYALAAVDRAGKGMNTLYDMTEENSGEQPPEETDPPVIPEIKFDDVNGSDWFCGDVAYGVEHGLFNADGTGNGRFSPNVSMSRAMLVTTLYRMEEKPEVTTSASFADVEVGSWYADAVTWANANGIVTGYPNGLFGTNDEVTREQIAVILYRYAAYKGYDISAVNDLSGFSDRGDVSDYAVDAMVWAAAVGLINGRTTADGTQLAPQGSAQRCEVAAVLHRFCENIA